MRSREADINKDEIPIHIEFLFWFFKSTNLTANAPTAPVKMYSKVKKYLKIYKFRSIYLLVS